MFPVFILDPHFIRSGRVGAARMTFLFDALTDLHSGLQQRSSSLFCVQGNPEHMLPQLFKQWNITRLAYEYDNEPYARSRDQRVTELAAHHGVNVVVRYGHTLHAPDALLAACGGSMPKSYGSFVAAAERLAVAPDVPAPASIKTPAKLWLADKHAVPSMQSLGLSRQNTPFPGGETEGLARLQKYTHTHSLATLPGPHRHARTQGSVLWSYRLQVHGQRGVGCSVRKAQNKSSDVCGRGCCDDCNGAVLEVWLRFCQADV